MGLSARVATDTAAAPRHEPWTLPQQPAPHQPSVGQRLGKSIALIGLAAVVAAALFRLVERHPGNGEDSREDDTGEPEREEEDVTAARDLGAAAAILAFSVLT